MEDYQIIGRSFNLTQQRLYSIDLTNHLIERWTSDFQGHVQDYTTNFDGTISFLGQLGIEIEIYSQISPENNSILHRGFVGCYQSISSSINSIPLGFSSFSRAQQVYFVDQIDQLKSARQITNENSQFDQIDLPQAKSSQLTNPEDNQMIEGILHYPPGKFEENHLSTLVLMHGGPTDASRNYFLGDWYNWAPMAAAEGWLVFEPNYRGSTGYGDQFVNDIRREILTKPTQDILSGVDQLIKDRISDPTK